MRLRHLFRRTPAGGDWCGPPPHATIRRRSGLPTKTGDACTSCAGVLEPVGRLPAERRAPDAAWWCPRCGAQLREADADA